MALMLLHAYVTIKGKCGMNRCIFFLSHPLIMGLHAVLAGYVSTQLETHIARVQALQRSINAHSNRQTKWWTNAAISIFDATGQQRSLSVS